MGTNQINYALNQKFTCFNKKNLKTSVSNQFTIISKVIFIHLFFNAP